MRDIAAACVPHKERAAGGGAIAPSHTTTQLPIANSTSTEVASGCFSCHTSCGPLPHTTPKRSFTAYRTANNPNKQPPPRSATHCCCPLPGGASFEISNSPSGGNRPFLPLPCCAPAAAAAAPPRAPPPAKPCDLLVARGRVASGSRNAGRPLTCVCGDACTDAVKNGLGEEGVCGKPTFQHLTSAPSAHNTPPCLCLCICFALNTYARCSPLERRLERWAGRLGLAALCQQQLCWAHSL